jgi:predicted regulator of Ras-like GTPase activity (Roadblock/LC7/MglB family)
MGSTSVTHNDLIKKLVKAIPEVKFAVVFDTNANLIAFAAPKDIEDSTHSIAISSLALHLSAQKLVNQLLLGDINHFQFKCSNGWLDLFLIDSERILLVKSAGDVRHGLILLDCRRTVEKLRKMEYHIPERKVSFEKKLQEIKKERERIEKEILEKKEKEKNERKKIEKNLKMKFHMIETLIQDKRLSKAVDELNDIRTIAKEYKLGETITWIDKKLDLCNKLEKQRLELEKINKIKKLVLELGTKFTRLEIREIGEKSSIDDEDIIIEVVKDMIKNKEIYAEYFSSSKAIAFDQQANIEEIDNLMAIYKEWEDKKVSKK